MVGMLNDILKRNPLRALYTAQFLSAFVDNMILFIALAIIKRDAYPGYYLPFVQSAFLAAYILLTPWVGRFADKKPKSQVLMVGNVIKALGIGFLLLGFNPAISYAVVGIGAVIYSPAKYGILPFLTEGEDQLLKANAKLESYTILAILTGSIAGGILSDMSVTLALVICLVLYGASMLVNILIPKDPGNRSISYKNAVSELWGDIITLFRNKQSSYSLIGTGSFWMASAVLRMIVFAWVPLTLGITSGTAVSLIIAVTGVGIAVGSLITPYLVSIKTYHRTAGFGFAMGFGILAFLFINNLVLTVIFLLIIGALGGIYIVPMNACLQQVGHQSLGAGKTVAIQNFVNNIFMFGGVGLYTLASKEGIGPNVSMGAAGITLLILVSYLFVYLYKDDIKRRIVNGLTQ